MDFFLINGFGVDITKLLYTGLETCFNPSHAAGKTNKPLYSTLTDVKVVKLV